MLKDLFFSRTKKLLFWFFRLSISLLILGVSQYYTIICPAATPVPITWTDITGVTVTGNTITKNAVGGWSNGGSASQETFSGDGGTSFTTSSVGTYSNNSAFGLSSLNSGAGFSSIEYAILILGNTIYVFESGAYKGSFGACLEGDILSVERTGNIVYYTKNGIAFYTSATTSNAPLLVDLSIHKNGGIISNVALYTNQVSALGQISSTSPVTVSWNANSEPDLTGYIVYYRDSKGNSLPSEAVGKERTSITLDLTRGLSYFFKVTAVDSSGNESLPSSEKSYTVSRD